MTTTYTYSVAADTANGKIDARALNYELRHADPPLVSSALVLISQYHDVIEVEFEGDLSAADQTALDGLLAVHSGLPVPESIVLQTAHVTSGKTIASTQWTTVGGVVTRPEVFAPLPQLSARVAFAVTVPAGGLDLRLLERDGDGTERTLGTWVESDTAGAWRFALLDAIGATPGTHEYLLEAKLAAGGANAEIRSASLSLVRTEGA